MKRFEIMQRKKAEKLSNQRLRAEYASLYRSLSIKNSDFRKLENIKKKMKGR